MSPIGLNIAFSLIGILIIAYVSEVISRFTAPKKIDECIKQNELGIQKDEENGAQTQKRTSVVHTVTRS